MPNVLTIIDPIAISRDGPPDFKETAQIIPAGTRVDVLSEGSKGGKRYGRVKNHETGQDLGWTLLANAKDLKQEFAAARADHVYFAAQHSLIVYVPQGGVRAPEVEVFMFFHGIGGDYRSTRTNQQHGGFEDNSGISADLRAAVNASGRNVIGICVQAINSGNPEWSAISSANYLSMIDAVLAHLSADLALPQALTASTISLAGHSAGGKALGPAALALDAQDVTLQDAGYGWYASSWQQLREWFVTGEAVKHLRILSVVPDPGPGRLNEQDDLDNTRHAQYFALARNAFELMARAQGATDIVFRDISSDTTTPREAGMTLDGGFDLDIDGEFQGSLRVFTIRPQANGNHAHWGAKDESMAAVIRADDADSNFGVA